MGERDPQFLMGSFSTAEEALAASERYQCFMAAHQLVIDLESPSFASSQTGGTSSDDPLVDEAGRLGDLWANRYAEMLRVTESQWPATWNGGEDEACALANFIPLKEDSQGRRGELQLLMVEAARRTWKRLLAFHRLEKMASGR
jgi:hypothetical protein